MIDSNTLRQEWIERRVDYLSKVMKEEPRWNTGQIAPELATSNEYQEYFEQLAEKHSFNLPTAKSIKTKMTEKSSTSH